MAGPARRTGKAGAKPRTNKFGSPLKKPAAPRRSRSADHQTSAAIDAVRLSDEITNDAEVFLKSSLHIPRLSELTEIEKIDWLTTCLVDAKVLSRKQHYEIIARAYATYVAMKRDEALRDSLMKAWRLKGRVADDRVPALRMIIELFIFYGDEQGPAEKRRAGKLYSRDVTAISNLIAHGIAPSQVIEKSQIAGEGLDKWCRMGPPRNPNEAIQDGTEPSAPVISKKPNTQTLTVSRSKPGYPNTIFWTQEDKNGKLVVKKRIDLSDKNNGNLAKMMETFEQSSALEDKMRSKTEGK